MDLSIFLGTAVFVFLGCVLQSAIGFALGLFAIPLLVWIGVPLQNAIAIMAVAALLQSFLGIRKLSADIPWNQVFLAVLSRLIFMAIGIYILRTITSFHVNDIKFFVGCIVLFMLVVQLLFKAEPVDRIHPGMTFLAFSASGFFAGICGMGGPPLVIWCHSQRWSNQRIRGFLFAVFGVSLPIYIGLMYLTFGNDLLESLLVGVCLFPFVLLSAHLGLLIGNKIPKIVLRRISYAILIIISINSIAAPFVQYLK